MTFPALVNSLPAVVHYSSSEHHVLSTHLVVADNLSKAEVLRVKQESRQVLQDLAIEHLTIEIEYEAEAQDLGHEA